MDEKHKMILLQTVGATMQEKIEKTDVPAYFYNQHKQSELLPNQFNRNINGKET